MFPFGASGGQQEQPVHLQASPLLFLLIAEWGCYTKSKWPTVRGDGWVEQNHQFSRTSHPRAFQAPDRAGLPCSHQGMQTHGAPCWPCSCWVPTTARWSGRSLLGGQGPPALCLPWPWHRPPGTGGVGVPLPPAPHPALPHSRHCHRLPGAGTQN